MMFYTPHKGKFRVSQTQHSAHDGLDIVGITSKDVFSTVDGTVERAGWENEKDHSQGFGVYVKIKKAGSIDRHFFGHLQVGSVTVKVGQTVRAGQKIGVEGSTGRSTGSHVHYCIRPGGIKALAKSVSKISGIPNELGTYRNDDGVISRVDEKKPAGGVTTLKTGSWNVRRGPSFGAAVDRVVKGPQSVTFVDVVGGDGIQWYKLRDGCYISVNACK